MYCVWGNANDDGCLHQGKGSARALHPAAGPALYKMGLVDCPDPRSNADTRSDRGQYAASAEPVGEAGAGGNTGDSGVTTPLEPRLPAGGWQQQRRATSRSASRCSYDYGGNAGGAGTRGIHLTSRVQEVQSPPSAGSRRCAPARCKEEQYTREIDQFMLLLLLFGLEAEASTAHIAPRAWSC